MPLIKTPFPVFTDVDGDPLEDGYVYIGQAGLNPEASPINIFWDEALTIPAAQPVRTLGGYLSRSGSPGNLYVSPDDFSVTVKNKNSSLVYSSLNVRTLFDISLAVVVFGTFADLRANINTSIRTVQVIGAITEGIGGGDFYLDSADTASTDNGVTTIVDAVGGRWKRIYEFGTIAMSETDAAAATAAFYADGKAMVVYSDETAKIVCDPTGGDDFQAICYWVLGCVVQGTGVLYVELADGAHAVSTYVDIDGIGKSLDLRTTASPDLIQITDIAYASVSGLTYSATITVDTALPAGAVVGGPIGIQNAQGTLDVATSNGCQIIESIAVDRLSFVVYIYSPEGAPSNGVLDNTLTNGITANQAVVFKASLIANSAGWDGTSREGFINCLNGGNCITRYMGFAYNGVGSAGGSSDEHDLIFARGSGSRFYAFDRCGFAGAGDKVLRSYGGAEFFINRSCIGGANKALELFQGVAGGFNQFVRTSSGGAKTAGFTCGHASFVNFAQAPVSTCGEAFRITTQGGAITAAPATIHKCTTGVLATQGLFSGTTATVINRCATGLDWAAGGVLVGNITMGAGADANTLDSIEVGNYWANGGIWYQNTAANGNFNASITISASVPKLIFLDGVLFAEINGDSGNLLLNTNSTSRDVKIQANSVDKNTFDTSSGNLINHVAGSGHTVTSPNGLVTKTITIDNAGALALI